MEYVKMIVKLLIIVGAINWGLVAYNGTDLVTMLALATGQPMVDRYIKYAVGVAGVYALYEFYLYNIAGMH
jgi:uncharacterized membrane protein YuzA (DUF378 family)